MASHNDIDGQLNEAFGRIRDLEEEMKRTHARLDKDEARFAEHLGNPAPIQVAPRDHEQDSLRTY